jgi:hypothetical protein
MSDVCFGGGGGDAWFSDGRVAVGVVGGSFAAITAAVGFTGGVAVFGGGGFDTPFFGKTEESPLFGVVAGGDGFAGLAGSGSRRVRVVTSSSVGPNSSSAINPE